MGMEITGLNRIPGVKGYRAYAPGVRTLANGPGVAKAAGEAARTVASAARNGGAQDVTVSGRSVVAGWNNESRAGAAVSVSYSSSRDRYVQARALARASGSGAATRPNRKG